MKAGGRRQKAVGSEIWRRGKFFVLLSAFCFLPSAFSCSSDGQEERYVSPDTARRELFLRGYDYKQDVFLDSAQDGDVIGVKLFLYAGMSPEVKNEAGETPLLVASRYGQTKAVRALLEKGADVNVKDAK